MYIVTEFLRDKGYMTENHLHGTFYNSSGMHIGNSQQGLL